MPTWTPLERFAFRFVFSYFPGFFLASMLDSGPAPRRLLARLSEPPVRWMAQGVAHLPSSAIGGPRWALAQQIVAFAITAIIATVWSLASHRTEYSRLRGWFFIALRYYVGCVMMVYGGFKVIESQFPPISLEQLAQPLGTMAPMGLLWAFMGYSTLYATFTGIGETVGAFLLFFRKTTTAGALILVAVLSNVVLLNYTFDVSVKQLSSNLLFAVIVLAASDVRRIFDVLVLNRATSPADLTFDFRRAWIYKTRFVLKPLIIALATIGPLAASAFVRYNLHKQSPLFGVYDVREFTRNGSAVAATDLLRWKRLIFDRGTSASVYLLNDSAIYYAATVDSANHQLRFRKRSPSAAGPVLWYDRIADGGLHLRGTVGSDSIDATLARRSPEDAFRLMRRR